MGEYCFGLMVCNEMKLYALRHNLATPNTPRMSSRREGGEFAHSTSTQAEMHYQSEGRRVV